MSTPLDGAPRVGLVQVDGDGVVVATDTEARALLGAVVGRPCHAAIAASLGGTRLCSASCAEHVTSGDDRKDVRGAVVKGHLTRLVCAPLGDGATIALVSAQDPIEDTTPLSPREREVLGLVAQGLTGKEIAARLKLSVSTVRTHVEHAREKLGAHSRAEAVQKATARGEL